MRANLPFVPFWQRLQADGRTRDMSSCRFPARASDSNSAMISCELSQNCLRPAACCRRYGVVVGSNINRGSRQICVACSQTSLATGEVRLSEPDQRKIRNPQAADDADPRCRHLSVHDDALRGGPRIQRARARRGACGRQADLPRHPARSAAWTNPSRTRSTRSAASSTSCRASRCPTATSRCWSRASSGRAFCRSPRPTASTCRRCG